MNKAHNPRCKIQFEHVLKKSMFFINKIPTHNHVKVGDVKNLDRVCFVLGTACGHQCSIVIHANVREFFWNEFLIIIQYNCILPTQMTAEMLDELNALVVLFLPELQMPILTGRYDKILTELNLFLHFFLIQ